MTLPPLPPDILRPLYCGQCGGEIGLRFVAVEERQRLVCQRCELIHYLNPRIVTNVLPERGGRVLLLRRAIEPSLGKWAFPGGFLELGESAEEGAEREAREEVGLQVKAGDLLGVYTRVDHGIVVVVFRSRRVSGRPLAGPEALDTAWFGPGQIPWADLAFETTEAALRDWVRASARPGPPGRPAR